MMTRPGHIIKSIAYIRDSPDLINAPPLTQAYILGILQNLGQTNDIKERLAKRLTNRCDKVWIQTSELADVALVYYYLYRYRPALLDGIILASLAKRLIAAEASVGGPYKTLDGRVDLATNRTVDLLLRAMGQSLPKVTAFIARHPGELLDQETFIIEYLKQKEGLSPLLKKALSIQKAISVQTAAKPSISILKSASFTTVQAMFDTLEEPLRTYAVRMLKTMQTVDKRQEIPGLPRFFAHGLLYDSSSPVWLDKLGRANIYCWIAYTIFDDFLDDEGQAVWLPLGTLALRRALLTYQEALPSNPTFADFVQTVFDNMDLANSWEITHCRHEVDGSTIHITSLPRYGGGKQLATRSFAHALGPMAILAKRFPMTDPRVQLVQAAFRHYLIARQLNDDAHDWMKDIQAGHSTFVVTYILRQLRLRPGRYDTTWLLDRMRYQFWHRGAQAISEHILRHTLLSRQAFVKSRLLKTDGPLFDLIDTIETKTKVGLAEYKKQHEFLDEFRK